MKAAGNKRIETPLCSHVDRRFLVAFFYAAFCNFHSRPSPAVRVYERRRWSYCGKARKWRVASEKVFFSFMFVVLSVFLAASWRSSCRS